MDYIFTQISILISSIQISNLLSIVAFFFVIVICISFIKLAFQLERYKRYLRVFNKSLGAPSLDKIPNNKAKIVKHWLLNLKNSSEGKLLDKGPILDAIETCLNIRHLATPDIGVIISSFSQKEIDKIDSYKNRPNQFLLLGITGTITGLLFALTFFSNNLESNFSNFIGSLSLAFITTFAGALAALFSNSLLQSTITLQMEVLNSFEKTMINKVVPEIFPENIHIKRFDLLEYTQKYEEKFVQTMAEGSKLILQMSTLISETKTNLEKIDETLVVSNNTIIEITKNFDKRTDELTVNLTEAMSKISTLLSNDFGTIQKSHLKLLKDLEEIKKESQQNNLENTQILGEYQKQLGTSFNNLLSLSRDQQKQDIDNLNSIINEVKEFKDYYEVQNEKLAVKILQESKQHQSLLSKIKDIDTDISSKLTKITSKIVLLTKQNTGKNTPFKGDGASKTTNRIENEII